MSPHLLSVDPPPPIWIYDFRDRPDLPDGPLAPTEYNGRHARVAALLRDILDFHRLEFGWRSHDGRGGRLALFLDSPRQGGWSDPYLGYLGLTGPRTYEGRDGRLYRFDDFAVSADYAAHEFQHLVTHACAELGASTPEAHALNESLSDCFAIAFRHWRARKAGAAARAVDWRFGAGVALEPLSCTRNLAEPGDPRAWTPGFAHWSEVRPNEKGVVDGYALSLVASLAFRRVAYALGEDVLAPARIWQAALADPRMRGVKTFAGFADLTLSTARARWREAEHAVQAGWASVGVAPGAPIIV